MDLTIITTAIAVIVAIITFGQWQNARDQLRHSLFEKRYAIYEEINDFLATVLQTGRIADGAEMEFLRSTKRAYFVFAADKEIKKLTHDIYKQAVNLNSLQSEQNSVSGERLEQNLEKQGKIKEWFEETLNEMGARFERYLKLKV